MGSISREKALRILRQNTEQLHALGVKSLAVFGSVARGESTLKSDIDILVSFDGPVTFDKYMDLKIYLEDCLDRTVDLVIADALHKRIAPYIQQDALYVTG